jgi:hypothetical protein
MDTTYIHIPSWDQMDSVIKAWIYDTISPDLQDVTWQRSHTTRDVWLALENHFLNNRKTRALHIDATFWSFVQRDLSVNDYCQKMKGFADSLADLGVDVTDRVLVLNFLRGLNKNFEHLRAIFTHAMPFPPFQKVLDDLCLKKNLARNSGAASHCIHPHHPLCHVEACVVLFLCQWAGIPTRIAATPTTPSTLTVVEVRQEEE